MKNSYVLFYSFLTGLGPQFIVILIAPDIMILSLIAGVVVSLFVYYCFRIILLDEPSQPNFSNVKRES